MRRSRGDRPLWQRLQAAINHSPGLRQRGRTFQTGSESLERRDVFAASLSLTGPPAAVFEGESAEFTLRLSEPVKTAERVYVTTVAGTATYGSDYFAPQSTQILFAPGQTSKTFSIATLRDAGGPKAEGLETFRVIATPVTSALGTRSATVTIADYVPPPGISVNDVRITEGDSGTKTATFTIGLSTSYPKPVTVSYATRDGTATVANADYVATSGMLTFAPGEISKAVGVTITGDRVLESDETFTLVLSAPTEATLAKGVGTCTIVNDEADQPGFQVTLKFLDSPSGPVPQSVRNVAQQAVNRWARIITGDLPAVTATGVFIDDFEMSIQMGLLGGPATDGQYGVLANATPTAFRDNGTGLPYAGITGLDPADSSGNSAILLDTITHEMGHAFGFTPNATVFSRLISGETFVGANALREYNSIFATTATGVPLQAGVRAHWDETVFGNELMTPFISGTPNSISRITVGALQDMGYTVNYAAAEAYARPRVTTPQVAAATGVAIVSANPTGSSGVPSGKLVQQASPTKPVQILLEPAVVKLIPAIVGAVQTSGVAASGSTPIAKVTPPKAASVTPMLPKPIETGVGSG